MKKSKQPFTIGGSVALKKALLEEAGLTPCSNDTVKHGYLIIETDTIKMAGRAFAKKDVHYHLPEEYDEALQAVKDFFAEEPTFEKGKWYYAVVSRYEFLFKVKDITDRIFELSEKIMYHPKTGAAYTTDDYVVKYSEVYKNSQPATKEQIHKMLTKVAEQKGLVKGVVIKVAGVIFNINGCSVYYNLNNDMLFVGGICVYQEGKWAELLPKEEVKPQKLVLKGVMIEYSDGLVEAQNLYFKPTHLQQLKAALAL
jgi:hypothetical protein